MKVYVAVIHHRHGEDVYVEANENALMDAVADFATSSWDEVEEDAGPLPSRRQDILDGYFTREDEWFDTYEREVPGRCARPLQEKRGERLVNSYEDVEDYRIVDEVDYESLISDVIADILHFATTKKLDRKALTNQALAYVDSERPEDYYQERQT